MAPAGKFIFALSFIFGCLLLAGCNPAAPVTPTATAVVIDGTLTIYNWDTYIDPVILTDFEEKFGVTINYITFEGPEELLEKVRDGQTAYDVIVPSDYLVAVMRDEGRLQPLRHEHIPNLANLDPEFVGPAYDP